MNDPLNDSAPEDSTSVAESSTATRAKLYAVVGAKLGLIGAIVVVLGSTFWPLISGDRPRAAGSNLRLPAGLMPLPAAARMVSDFGDGHWQFSDSAFRFRIAVLDEAELEATFEQPPTPPLALPPFSEEQREAQAAVLDVMRSASPTLEQRDGLTVMRASQAGLRGIALFQGDPDSGRLLVARYAWPEGDQWRVMESTPPVLIANNATPPLPEEVELRATRFTDAGEVTGQMAFSPLPPNRVAEAWRAAGWEVHDAPAEVALGGVVRMLVSRASAAFLADFMPQQAGGSSLVLTATTGPISTNQGEK